MEPGAALPAADRGGELALGEDGQTQLGPLRPGGEGPHGDGDLARRGHGGEGEVQRGRDPPLFQDPVEVDPPLLAAAQEEHRRAALPVVAQVPLRRVQAAAVGAQLLGGDGQEGRGGHRVPGGGQGVHHAQGRRLQGLLPLPLPEEQGREVHPLPPLQEALRVLPGLPEDALHPLRQPAALAQEEGPALPHEGEDAAARLPQKLRHRQQADLVHVPQPPLGQGVKDAHGVDLVVKKVAADRLVHPRGEHVQDAAPEGELAHALHLVAAGVPRRRQVPGQGLQIEALPHLQGADGPQQGLPGAGPLEHGLRRGHHRALPALQQGAQGRQPLEVELPGGDGAGGVVQLPGGDGQDLPAGEGPEVLRHPGALPLVGAQDHRRLPRRQGQGGGHLGAVDGGQARDGHGAGALPEGLGGLPGLRQGQQGPEQLFHGTSLLSKAWKKRGQGPHPPRGGVDVGRRGGFYGDGSLSRPAPSRGGLSFYTRKNSAASTTRQLNTAT